MTTNEFATESGHWYTRAGAPMYTIIGKNGAERPTTLRDAKKLSLVPSVTTIIKMAAAPALERWKTQQMVLAAITLPRVEGEDERTWMGRVSEDGRAEAALAASRGSSVHTAIEHLLKGEEADPEFAPFAQAAVDEVNRLYPGQEWESERSFASPLGYGGRVDLHSKGGVVLDFKGKDADLSLVKLYDEHYMQASAYAHGLGMPEAHCANVFFRRYLPAGAIVIPHDEIEFARGWRMFKALLEFFRAKSGLAE